MGKLISIVIPCYNEQEVIKLTHDRMMKLDLGEDKKEIIYVDDGSRDDTLEILKEFAKEDTSVKVISFSRNFGHQCAVSAGMEAAGGDAVVVIDADLQDPPEVIPQMIEKWKQGFDIVYGKRTKRKGESAFKKFTAFCYYRILQMLGGQQIPTDTGDFRLLDKRVNDTLCSMKESNRFLRGMSGWAGFKSTPVEFVREERAAGQTKYTFKKMMKLAGNGITAFSDVPLKLPLYFGIPLMVLSIIYLIVSVILCATIGFPYLHILFSLVFMLISGLFISSGVMGIYLSRVYDEAKGRPNYIIDTKINL